MAKLRRGILGQFTGKIGSVVAVIRNNTVYIRALPKKSTKPRTAGQLAAQEKFKLVHAVLKPLKPFIGAGFKHLAINKTAMELAYTITYHRAIFGVYPDLTVDYSKLVLSEGRLWPLKAPIMVLEPENQVRLTWEVDWTPYSHYDDQVMLVLNCPALGIAEGTVNIGIRFQQECLYKINKRMIGHELHVYVGLVASNGKKASNSQYLGRVLPI